jgi:hypothetical protein
MRIAKTWSGFKKLFDKAFPSEQLMLPEISGKEEDPLEEAEGI